MTRRSMIQQTNSGTGGPLVQSGKVASSESSAFEKAEDTGERQNGFPHHVRSLEEQPGTLTGFIGVVDDAVLDYNSLYENNCTSSFDFQKGDRTSIKSLGAPYLNKVAPSKWDDAEKWLVSPTSVRDAPVKAKTKSGPLYVHHGYVGSHPGRRSNASNQHEWHGHSHAIDNGYQTQYASDHLHGGNTVLLVDDDSHLVNAKLLTISHLVQPLDLAEEWTRNMDAIKGPSFGSGGAPNFAFMPAPSRLPKGSSLPCYPLVDETVITKEVSVSHEEDYDKSLVKPISRTRKPTSDSLISAPYTSPAPAVRSISMRDMGTEMTPIASQEPSRTGTPLRATTPTLQSPVSSHPSTPRQGSPMSPVVCVLGNNSRTLELSGKTEVRKEVQIPGVCVGGKVSMISWASREEEDADASKSLKNVDLEEVKKNVLETRAAAWEEAEQSKYMARFQREEASILAWESHQKAKAEAELKRIEVKVEKIRMHAHEKLMEKLAAARQKAEKRLAAAEEKRCEQAAKTAHRADYIRQTGRLPSSFFGCNFCL